MLGTHDAQATIPVKSLIKARPFYEHVLELEPLPSANDGVHVSGEMKTARFKDPDGDIINIGNY